MKSLKDQIQVNDPAFYWFAAFITFTFFVSKSFGLINGYAIDDYSDLLSFKGVTQVKMLLEGRFTAKLLQDVLDLSGLKLQHYSGLGFILCIIGIVIAGWMTLAGWLRGNVFLAIALGSLLGSHPFFSEYISFRGTILGWGLIFTLIASASVVYAQQWKYKFCQLLISAVLAVIAIGINQLALPLFIIVVLGISLQKYAGLSFRLPLLFNVAKDTAQVVGIAIFCYVFVFFLTRPENSLSYERTSILAASEIVKRLYDVIKLLKEIFTGGHPLVGPVAAAGIVFAFFVLIIRITKQKEKWSQVFFGLLTLAIGVTVALTPITISRIWWPMPRTLIVMPLVFVLSIAILSTGASRVQLFTACCALLLASFIFIGKSSKLLLDQQRLNRWDIGLARDIVLKVAETTKIDGSTSIVIHNYKWAYGLDINMPIGDANVSAMSVIWAVEDLFKEASGQLISVKLGTESEKVCGGVAGFPSAGSIIKSGTLIHVCL